MASRLFVGGLPYSVNDDELRQLFEGVGTVESAQVIVDRYSNQSKGFGFVQMSTDDETKKAIEELNGKEVGGRSIAVNEARPREERPRGSFGGGDRGGDRGGFRQSERRGDRF